MAIVFALRKLRHYLEGRPFELWTDHAALRFLMTMKDTSNRVTRWALTVQQYDFIIKHIPGTTNRVADALSRAPLPVDSQENVELGMIQLEFTDKTRLTAAELEKRQSEDPQLQALVESKKITKKQNFWYKSEPTSLTRIYLPVSLHPTALRAFHDHPTAAHMGFKKTLKRIQPLFWWPTLEQDVADYVRSCENCQAVKGHPSRIFSQHPIRGEGPMHTIACDFFGPLPASENDNRFILVLQDVYSPFIWTIPMKKADSELTQDTLLRFFCNFGFPHRLICDAGPGLAAGIVQNMLKIVQVERVQTPPYAHHANGIVERSMAKIRNAISAYITRQTQTTWDKHLPAITFAINSAIHEGIGDTPYFYFFNRDPRSPFYPNVAESNKLINHLLAPENKHLHDARIQQLINSFSHMENLQQQNAATLMANDDHKEFKIGNLVAMHTPQPSNAAKNFAGKLAPAWTFPFRIIGKMSDNIYKLQHTQTKKIVTHVHISRIRKFTLRDNEQAQEGGVTFNGYDVMGNRVSNTRHIPRKLSIASPAH